MSPHLESVKQGYYVRRMWACESACGGTHYKQATAEACEAKFARRRDSWSCADCGQRFTRGSYGPAQIEATLRRHEGSARHLAAVTKRIPHRCARR